MSKETDAKITTKTIIKEPPTPGATQTIVVPTTPPPLIPEEDTIAYCFNRRNMFDIIIGLIIAGVIIYLVMKKDKPFGMPNITGMFQTGTTGSGIGTGVSTSTGVLGTGTGALPKPVTATGLGSGIGQLGGYLKKLFK